MMTFLLFAPASTKWLGWRKDRKSRGGRLGRFCDIYCAVVLPYSCVMHQSIPAAPSPPPPRATAGHLPALSVPGVGHLQFCAAREPGISQPRGPFPSFCHERGFLSEYNYTDDFFGKESRLAHLSWTGKNWTGCKRMFLILCMHFFIAYPARVT